MPASAENLADALAALDVEVRKENPSGGVVLTVDEIQAATPSDLTLIAAALQSLNRHHRSAHVMFAGSGLPNTQRVLEQAGVTHSDRLFDIHPVPLLLDSGDARFAIVEPARERRVSWEPEAAELIVEVSSGYPAHLQLFADHVWRTATGPQLITLADAHAGAQAAARELERRSLGPRFERMSDHQREFLTAIAVNGGRVSTADLATTLGRPRGSLSQLRDTLLGEGDIYVPRRGELALTAPVLGPYLLANYEEARAAAAAQLVTLDEMQRNVKAIDPARRNPSAAQLPPTQQDGEASAPAQ